MFEKRCSISNPWNTQKRTKRINVSKKRAEKFQVSRDKELIKLKKGPKPGLYLSTPSLLYSDVQYKSVAKRRSEGNTYLETGADVLQYTSKIFLAIINSHIK